MTPEEELNALLAAGKLVGGDYKGQTANSRRMQEAAYRNAVTPTDTSGLVKVGQERENTGYEQLGQGLMLGTGPSWLAPMGQTAFKSGTEKQGPWEVGEGVYSNGAYTADPFKRQDRLTKAMGGQADAQSAYAAGDSQEQGRVLTRALQQSQETRAKAQELRNQAEHSQKMAIGKIGKTRDADGNEHVWQIQSDGNIRYLHPSTVPVDLGGTLGATGGGAAPANGMPPSAGKPTGEQAKAIAAAIRLAPATNIMKEMLDTGFSPDWGDATWSSNQGGAFTGLATNLLASGKGKRFYGAGRDALAALLRRESGAAVTENEWEEFAPLWLPWYTDTPELRKDKLDRLETQMAITRGLGGNRAGGFIDYSISEAEHKRKLREMAPGSKGGGGGPRTDPAVAARAAGYLPK